MQDRDRPQDAGTGALFKNDKREKETHPLYKGECEINGEKFWISAWLKKSTKDGQTFMSLAFRAKDAPAKQKPPASRANFDRPLDDDVIPF